MCALCICILFPYLHCEEAGGPQCSCSPQLCLWVWHGICPQSLCKLELLQGQRYDKNTFSFDLGLVVEIWRYWVRISNFQSHLDEPAYILIASESGLKKTNPQKPYGNETSHIFSSRDPSSGGKIDSIDYIFEEDGGVRIFWSSLTLKTIQTLYQRENSNSLNLVRGIRRKRSGEIAQNIVSQLIHMRLFWCTKTTRSCFL
jgi:hypothetical protein